MEEKGPFDCKLASFSSGEEGGGGDDMLAR